jgi:hypothetical protein
VKFLSNAVAFIRSAPALVLVFLASPRFNNARAMAQVAVPVLLGGLVNGHVLTQDHANLWLAFGLAVLSPALAAKLTPDTFRTWFFGVVAALQSVLVGVFGIAFNGQVALWISIATSVVSSAVAAANVHRDNPSSSAPANPASTS